MCPRKPGSTRILAAAFLTAALVLATGSGAQQAGSAPRISYTKILKGSTPEFEQVTVDQSGVAACDTRKLSEPANPRTFKLSPATTQKIFGLAARLHNFQGIELESRRPVANLGRKTLTYESGGEKTSVEFNYTANRDAEELTDVFEGIVSVNLHAATLEYSIRYDPLGLPRELSLIQMDLERKALADPELLAPQLEAIVRDSRFLHVAQVRAENLLHELKLDRN
jgi:hypothetical protein